METSMYDFSPDIKETVQRGAAFAINFLPNLATSISVLKSLLPDKYFKSTMLT